MVCQKKLVWYELIPLVSFVVLVGRCRTCKTKISLQYPLVEFVTGLIFAILFFKFQDMFFLNISTFSFAYAYYALAFSLLVVIAVYDIRHKIIPDMLALFLGILAFIGLFLFNIDGSSGLPLFYPHIPTFLDFASGFLIAFPFAFFWLISGGRWMGLGDAKLAIGLGWLLGLSRALSGIVLSFWIGAVVGILLVIFSKKYKMKSEIPFAPYLVLGTLLAFLFELHIF